MEQSMLFNRKMETNRLILRNWQHKDATDYIAFASDPEVMLAAGSKPVRSRLEAMNAFHAILGDFDAYAIYLKAEKRAIGNIRFQEDLRRYKVNSISIGYELNRNYWGNGYMPEALKAMIRYAFLHKKVDVIGIAHFSENGKSKRVIEKCGFQYEGSIPMAFKRFDGIVFNEETYSLLRADFEAGEWKPENGSQSKSKHT